MEEKWATYMGNTNIKETPYSIIYEQKINHHGKRADGIVKHAAAQQGK